MISSPIYTDEEDVDVLFLISSCYESDILLKTEVLKYFLTCPASVRDAGGAGKGDQKGRQRGFKGILC